MAMKSLNTSKTKTHTGKSKRNGYISTSIWPTKIDPRAINHINRSIISNETEAVTQVSRQRKAQDPMDSLLNPTNL
jgi:hypothetical protein